MLGVGNFCYGVTNMPKFLGFQKKRCHFGNGALEKQSYRGKNQAIAYKQEENDSGTIMLYATASTEGAPLREGNDVESAGGRQ